MVIESGLGDIDVESKNGWNYFKGLEGIPYRSKANRVPLVKRDDPEHMQPKLANEIDVKIFDLADDEDRKEYAGVLNFCAQRRGRIIDREIEYDSESKNWKVLVSWATYFWEDPAEAEAEQRKQY